MRAIVRRHHRFVDEVDARPLVYLYFAGDVVATSVECYFEVALTRGCYQLRRGAGVGPHVIRYIWHAVAEHFSSVQQQQEARDESFLAQRRACDSAHEGVFARHPPWSFRVPDLDPVEVVRVYTAPCVDVTISEVFLERFHDLLRVGVVHWRYGCHPAGLGDEFLLAARGCQESLAYQVAQADVVFQVVYEFVFDDVLRDFSVGFATPCVAAFAAAAAVATTATATAAVAATAAAVATTAAAAAVATPAAATAAAAAAAAVVAAVISSVAFLLFMLGYLTSGPADEGQLLELRYLCVEVSHTLQEISACGSVLGHFRPGFDKDVCSGACRVAVRRSPSKLLCVCIK